MIPRAIASKTIILAEDDEDDASLFKDLFEELHLGFELTIVGNGVLLMDHLTNNYKVPEIVFIDLNMPLKNGLECLQEISKNERLKNIRLIILSTSSDARHLSEAYRLGAEQYLIKPTDFLEYKKMISNFNYE